MKKITKKAHKFSINVGSAAKLKQVKHEMKETPAYEKLEKKLMSKYKKGRKKAKK